MANADRGAILPVRLDSATAVARWVACKSHLGFVCRRCRAQLGPIPFCQVRLRMSCNSVAFMSGLALTKALKCQIVSSSCVGPRGRHPAHLHAVVHKPVQFLDGPALRWWARTEGPGMVSVHSACETSMPRGNARAHRMALDQSFKPRSRSALAMTDTELRLIAAAAIIGLSSRPNTGNSTPAAIGMPSVL